MAKTVTTKYEVSEHLRTPQEMAAYLEMCIEEANGDAAFITKALGNIARAKGMSQVARDAGLSRESLNKALSGERSPGFDTILKVISALGLKLHTEAARTTKLTAQLTPIQPIAARRLILALAERRNMERCSICNCILHRTARTYAQPSPKGRSHATKHHYVAERFFGRSANRKDTKHQGVFDKCLWGYEGETAVFCYECHEELLHNPVFLPEEITLFAEITKRRGLSEESKSKDRSRLAGRIELLHEVISKGLKAVAKMKATANSGLENNSRKRCAHSSAPQRRR